MVLLGLQNKIFWYLDIFYYRKIKRVSQDLFNYDSFFLYYSEGCCGSPGIILFNPVRTKHKTGRRHDTGGAWAAPAPARVHNE